MKSIQTLWLFLLLLSSNFVSAQVDIIWEKTYGGSGNDEMKTIIKSSDSGFLAIGHTNSTDNHITNPKGGYDIWLMKLSERGEILWQNNYGGSGDERSSDVIETSDGNIVILGSTRSIDGDVSSSNGGFDFWIAKLTPLGKILWETSIGGSGDDQSSAVIETKEGDLVVVGTGESDDFVSPGNNGDHDLWAAKLSGVGDLIWLRNYGGTKYDSAESVLELESNFGYIIAGSYGALNGTDVGDHEGWILNVSEDCNMIWEIKIGDRGHDAFFDLVETTSGQYIASGYTFSDRGDFIDQNGRGDAFIVKIENTGAEYWRRLYGGSNFDYSSAIYPTDDFGVVFTGVTESSDGDVEGLRGPRDLWIGKLDIFGDMEWQKVIGSRGFDESSSILQTQDGQFLIAGEISQQNGDVSNAFGENDIWLAKIGDRSVSTSEAINETFLVYPNPASKHLYIDIVHTLNSTYKVYNSSGQIVLNDSLPESKKIDVEELNGGLYTLSLIIENEIRSIKFLKE